PTIILFPFAAWLFLGVGIPWALALLPREDWRARVTVIAVGMALGPLAVTAWMFVIGTWGRITLGGTLAGSAALALLGNALTAWRFTQSRKFATPHITASETNLPAPHPLPDSPSPYLERGMGGEVQHESEAAADQSSSPPNQPPPGLPHAWGRKQRRGSARGLLITGIALVFIVTTLITAWWPFIAYDTQWVYGYNARLFLLEERIPDDIGYYPQLIPLSYTYMQQAWHTLHDPGDGSLFNDHAARVVVPWFNLAMILMAYVLGHRIFKSRRVGLLTAAIWTLYPHVAAWSGAGDLEITLTLYMTGAAVFFIEAWRTEKTVYAILSGILFSGALWTKPTGGAFALGVGLAVAGWLVIVRGDRAAIWTKFRIALITGIASAPLGGMWYIRNVALGHEAVIFPASYWHGFAQRSGQEFGWPLLIALLAAGGLVMIHHRDTENTKKKKGKNKNSSEIATPPLQAWREGRGVRFNESILLAIFLLLLGIMPTALNPDAIIKGDNLWRWLRGDLITARRLNLLEISAITAGFGLLLWQGREIWRRWARARRETILLIWALLLPYAVVWFFNFSYHYRLSFGIVPLAMVQVAALIDGWLWDWLAAQRIGRMIGSGVIVGATALAISVAGQHTFEAWRDGVADDVAKYDRGNPGLMVVVHKLEDYADQHGAPVIAIPGEDRLPFFFPTWDIRNSRETEDLPTSTEDLSGVDLYIENSSGVFLMQRAGIWPNPLSAEMEVAKRYYDLDVHGWDGEPWPTVLEPIPIGPHGTITQDDGEFYYAIFTILPAAREKPMQPGALREDTVLIGDFAQFVGHDMGNLRWVHGQRIALSLYWRPTGQAPAARDYSLYIHLLDENDEIIAQWDDVPLQGFYSTRFWRPGESLLDYRLLQMPEKVTRGPAKLKIGFYNSATGERLPVTVNGEIIGDGIVIEDRIVAR
ncbi:MAG: glycosyltransferase family 39 protein, partial [Anaerolineae bacterium]|nr:glycosyltransferase family 39 protein [Anaerolineae bacterium]